MREAYICTHMVCLHFSCMPTCSFILQALCVSGELLTWLYGRVGTLPVRQTAHTGARPCRLQRGSPSWFHVDVNMGRR